MISNKRLLVESICNRGGYIRASINNNQMAILRRCVALGSIDSVELAKCQDITVQAASGSLRRLYDKGAMHRKEIKGGVGGYHFLYTVGVTITSAIKT